MDHEGLEIVDRKTLVYSSKVSIIDKKNINLWWSTCFRGGEFEISIDCT
jgi:hypothetical protein